MVHKSIGRTGKDLERGFVKNWPNSVSITDPIAFGSEKKTNSARALSSFANFFAVPAQLPRKRRNLKSTREQERQGDKFYHLSLNSDAFPSRQLRPNFPTFK